MKNQDKENIVKAYQSADLLLQDLRDVIKTDNSLLNMLGMKFLKQVAEITSELKTLNDIANEPPETLTESA